MAAASLVVGALIVTTLGAALAPAHAVALEPSPWPPEAPADTIEAEPLVVEPLATGEAGPGVPLPHRGSVFRLYRAFFLRDPDVAGLIHWEVRHHLAGVDLWRVADRFASSSEFQGRYGRLSDAAFVDLVYRNVFDRTPDTGGGAYWRGRLADGMSRGAVMVGFSESPEMQRRTRSAAEHLVAPSPPMPGDPLPGHDDWLGWINLHREGAGLDAVVENPLWSEGAAAHAHYAVSNQTLTNDQDPSLPLSSPEGQAAAESSNLFGGIAPLTHHEAISGWLNSPGHAAWMINPDWLASGFGEHHQPTQQGPLRWAAVLDVVRGAATPTQVPQVVRFPGPNQQVHHRPNHLYVIFPTPVSETPHAVVRVDGVIEPAEAVAVSSGPYPFNTVAVSLSERVAVGSSVQVQVEAGSLSTAWSFGVAASPPSAPAATSTTTPSGLIALRLGGAAGSVVDHDDDGLRWVVELWDDGVLVERAVTTPDRRLVFLHGGPPAAGLEVRTWAVNGVGTSPVRMFAY